MNACFAYARHTCAAYRKTSRSRQRKPAPTWKRTVIFTENVLPMAHLHPSCTGFILFIELELLSYSRFMTLPSKTWSARKTACTAERSGHRKTGRALALPVFRILHAVTWRRPLPRACPARGSAGDCPHGSRSKVSAPGRSVRARRRCGSWTADSFAPARHQNTP